MTTIELPTSLLRRAIAAALPIFPSADDGDDHPALWTAPIDAWDSLANKLGNAMIFGNTRVKLTAPELAAFQAAFEIGAQACDAISDAEYDVVTDVLTIA